MSVKDNVTDDSYDSVSVKFRSIFDPVHDNLIGITMLVVGMISVGGNGIAARVFQQRKVITVPEIFLLNIAIVNLILAIASYPAFIISAFAHHWMFGETGCALYAGSCYFLGLSTILSLTALAVFRFVKTCFPQKGVYFDARNTCLLILFIYVYSAVWSLMPVFGIGGYEVEPFGLSCTLDWNAPDLSGRLYIILVSVFCVLLPTVVIFASHLAIFCEIRRATGMRQGKSVGKQGNRAEMQFYRVSLGVCLGFLVAWLPYTFFSLYSVVGDMSAVPLWLTPIPAIMAKSSIAYNPIIYVMLTRRYRMDFIIVIREILHLSGKKNSVVSPQPSPPTSLKLQSTDRHHIGELLVVQSSDMGASSNTIQANLPTKEQTSERL